MTGVAQIDTEHIQKYAFSMASRKTLNVSLTAELQRFVDRRVASGRYQTASEVVRDGLRLLEDRERATERDIDSMKRKISSGLKQARAGEVLDGDQVLAALRRRTVARRRKAG